MLKPSMQTLMYLDISVQFLGGETDDPFCGLADELEHISSNNIVEDLTIEVDFHLEASCPPGSAWGRLDKALAQFGWPKLQRVYMIISAGPFTFEPQLRHDLELLEAQFQWLSSNKSLIFEFEVQEK